MLRNVFGIAAHARHNGRAVPGQPRQPDGVQARVFGDAAVVPGVVPFVQHGDVQDAEVQPVARGPEDRRDVGGLEVQPGRLRRKPVVLARRLRLRCRHAGGGNIAVEHRLHPPAERRLHQGQAFREVIIEDEAAVVGCFQVAVQPDAAAAEVPQVDVVAAVGAGHQRVAGEPRRGGGQLPHGEAVQSVVGAELCPLHHPIEQVLAAVPARCFRAGGHRQVDFAADGEQFLGDLAAGLAGTDDEHGTVGQLARVAVAVGVKLQDAARRLRRQRGGLRRLVAAGSEHHVPGSPAVVGWWQR